MMAEEVHDFEVETERWEPELGERVAIQFAVGEQGGIAWTLSTHLPWSRRSR